MNFSLKGGAAKKATVAQVFAESSSDEEDATAKKGSAPPPAKPAVSASDIRSCADKLAEWVAKNGRQFEDVTRSRNPGETPFKFLHDKSSPDYAYYITKVHEWEAKLGKAAPPPAPAAAAPPAPPPAAPAATPTYAPFSMPAAYPVPFAAPPQASYPLPAAPAAPPPYPAPPYAPAAPYAPPPQTAAYAPLPYGPPPPAPYPAPPAVKATPVAAPGLPTYPPQAQAPPVPQAAAPWHQPAAQPPLQPPLPGASHHTAPRSHSYDRERERDGSEGYREHSGRGGFRERGARDRDRDFSRDRLSTREREREESRSKGSYFLQIREVEAEMARSCQAAGDSVAAMDAYMKLAAKKDRLSKLNEEELEEERRKARPEAALLNETSFDRRRVTAVYKQDGGRGHHMQDFIPPEELAKLAAKSGDKAAAEALEKKNAIDSSNIGHKMLSKMGWKEGQSLGATQAANAITTPITAGAMNQEKSGLGAGGSAEDTAADDPFEAYRKRMMLGYKYRPNPLGNPRKQYY